ncbi:tripartite tricarboxylate transporter substrate binding protein [Microbacteriaceae bacterium K1510]|nr:tripartite tricarboxylate transporter substrate binding protein [Microbacteriaceae bacterium K1510]
MKRHVSRFLSAALGSLLAIGAVASAWAEPASDYPSRPIRVVVPYPPGGPPDVIARIVAAAMEARLGKPMIIENKPGAATTLGTVYASRAQADGYTLLAVEPSFVVVPSTHLSPGYDPIKDFRPVSLWGRTFHTLGVATNVPVSNVKEFIAYANAHPNAIKIGHSGVGTPPFLSALSFVQATNANVLMVPYRGTALVVNDVAGGHVSAVFTGPSTTAPLANAGKLKILGITGPKRITALPNVPTFKESGIDMKGVNNGIWFGLVAPAGTPDAVIAKLNVATKEASQDKDVIAKLETQGIDPAWTKPEEMGQLMSEELAHWHDALQKAGVKPE